MNHLVFKRTLFVLIPMISYLPAKAELFKRVDDFGNVTYTNIPPKGSVPSPAKNIPVDTSQEPGTPKMKPAPSQKNNRSFVSTQEQSALDSDRQRILEAELSKAQTVLSKAKDSKLDAAGITRVQADVDSLKRELASLAKH